MISFLAEIIITLVPCSSPAEQFISVTAIFSGKMEVTKVAFLLLFLGVVNAEVCERKGEEIHTCTQCMWMYQDPIEGNRCQFCEDDEQKRNYEFFDNYFS